MAQTKILVDLDGGSGGVSPGSGGGNPGTPTGSNQTTTVTGFPAGEAGGVIASAWYLFVPVQSIQGGNCYIGYYDITSFNDTLDGSSYSYRVEDINKDRVPTVNRVVLTYRDLGLATITITLQGVNDDNQVKSISVTVSIGNIVPTNQLMTKFVDIELTAFRPQLTISRGSSSGPVSIVQAVMRGEVETNQ